MSHRKRHLYTGAAAAAIAIAGAAVALGATTGNHRAGNRPPPKDAALITVQTNRPGRTIPPGFLGLSLEYPAVTAYAGTNPHKLNPLFLRLVRELTPGQSPVLRIGGDSTDWTWWPTPAIPQPPGVRITLTRRWLETTEALQRASTPS